jgi:hypothetical protein
MVIDETPCFTPVVVPLSKLERSKEEEGYLFKKHKIIDNLKT